MEITILKWEKHQARKEIKNPWWFKFTNRLFEDPDFFDFSHEEIMVWIYLLSQASCAQRGHIMIRSTHVIKIGRFKPKVFSRALSKLQKIECIRIEPTSCAHRGHEMGTAWALEERREEEREGDKPSVAIAPNLSPTWLVELWNTRAGGLPKVKEFSDKRRKKALSQLSKYPDPTHWETVITKFVTSEFCKSKWQPGFDDFLSEEKRLKAIEGKYDNRSNKRNTDVVEAF